MFSTSAEEVTVAAAADIQQRQQDTFVDRRICCTKRFDGWCTHYTENVRDHYITVSLGPPIPETFDPDRYLGVGVIPITGDHS